MKDMETKEKFIELRAQGWSLSKIAHKLNVSKQTLVQWSKELAEHIANLKAIELEALQERYCLFKKSRIKLFGEQVRAIRKELENRKLADISTERLLELLIKYINVLKLEEVNVEEVFREPEERMVNSFRTLMKRH